ncbi:MAG: hypothetical protein ACM3ZS_09380 [Nitrososphaerota archaeon]
MVKRLWLTILLSVLISGVGHMYLGFIKRGITILIFTIVIGYAAPGLIPMYGWIIVIGLWIWQIYDVSNHYEKLNPEEQDTK